MTTRRDVQRCYDATMAANAADPYVHADYEAAEKALVEANVAYYGETLAPYAREVQLDCGEVWTLERMIGRHVGDAVPDLIFDIAQSVHIRDDREREEQLKKIAAKAAELAAIDPDLDIKEFMAGMIVQGYRQAAADFGIAF